MKTTTIKTFKFIAAAAAVSVWVAMLREVFAMGGAFIEQAPYCIAGTMLIFGILTGVFKGLERLERRE
jgi:hypothetical protein